MAEAAKEIQKRTIQEFDVFLDQKSDAWDYELIDGEIVMMSNPTETHEQIASNIAAPLKLAMDKRGCRTYQGGMRVRASDVSKALDKYKPDVVVRCGPRENKIYIADPIVIVEVLSPSTIDFDRCKKLMFHKNLSSLRHIVLAYSDGVRLEHYYWMENRWEFRALTSFTDVLDLTAVEYQVDVAQVYFDLEF